MNERLIEVYANRSDWKKAAETIGIKKSTARSMLIIRHTNSESMED